MSERKALAASLAPCDRLNESEPSRCPVIEESSSFRGQPTRQRAPAKLYLMMDGVTWGLLSSIDLPKHLEELGSLSKCSRASKRHTHEHSSALGNIDAAALHALGEDSWQVLLAEHILQAGCCRGTPSLAPHLQHHVMLG